MTDSEGQERNTAETAYWFRVLGYYGTVSKAVTALRNRKGMDHIDRQSATDALNEELALLDRTQALIQDVLKRAKKSYHPQLTNEQFESGTEFIRKELTREFPDLTQSIEYMIAMLWHMPRVR
ncbi:MAG: hypothetical protein R3C18_11335 [Planctomycetaceae bacterium]